MVPTDWLPKFTLIGLSPANVPVPFSGDALQRRSSSVGHVEGCGASAVRCGSKRYVDVAARALRQTGGTVVSLRKVAGIRALDADAGYLPRPPSDVGQGGLLGRLARTHRHGAEGKTAG